MNHMTPFLSTCLTIGQILLVSAMALGMARLLRGPSAQDRILALDNVYISGMLLIQVLGLIYGTTAYFEAALLIAIFGFVSSMAMTKFLLRGEVIE
ncbi:MAG: Na(+)/H(+) antiporter subunit F [Paracidovorax wautersii]|uniref:Na(+)/H(+) antiporter subunit F n=1 Tax=Paracidovorax wautersii TaxID=1177982 RepID=A0A7V8FMI6_9BURK|nr:MAG: Na(+)/H(+) antiporter subunit F [Paracidovorax wautersii]